MISTDKTFQRVIERHPITGSATLAQLARHREIPVTVSVYRNQINLRNQTQLESRCRSPISPRTRRMPSSPSSTSESVFETPPMSNRALTHVFVARSRYFTSRPDLLSRVSGAAGQEYPETQSTAPSPSLLPPGASAAALTTAAQRTLANPAASRMLAAGIQRAATTGTGHGRAGGGLGHGHTAAAVAPLAMAALPSLVGPASGARNNGAAGNYDGHNANPNPPSAGVGVGRVAAAAQAFSSSSPKPANSNRLVPQKVGRSRSSPEGTIRSDPSTFVVFLSFAFSLFLVVVAVALLTMCGDDVALRWVTLRCVGGCVSLSTRLNRNSVMSTCRPLARCSAPCADRRPRRTRHLRRCTRRLHLLGRKPRASLHHPPCAAYLRPPPSPPRPSQKRRRRRPGRGQRRCMIIRARYAYCLPSFLSWRIGVADS